MLFYQKLKILIFFLFKNSFLTGLYNDSGFPHVAFSQCGFVKSSLVATATELLIAKMSLPEGGKRGRVGFSGSAASPQ